MRVQRLRATFWYGTWFDVSRVNEGDGKSYATSRLPRMPVAYGAWRPSWQVCLEKSFVANGQTYRQGMGFGTYRYWTVQVPIPKLIRKF